MLNEAVGAWLDFGPSLPVSTDRFVLASPRTPVRYAPVFVHDIVTTGFERQVAPAATKEGWNAFGIPFA